MGVIGSLFEREQSQTPKSYHMQNWAPGGLKIEVYICEKWT